MTPLQWFIALLVPYQVQAAAVFAHFMVSNVPSWGSQDWKDNMASAVTAHIDAFALNIAAGTSINDPQIALAFATAEADTSALKLFFSFDYAGNGDWAEGDVTALINKYSSSPAYYLYNNKPFVSTFEGPDRAEDWVTIKASTNCFFVPDWSSAGANVAVGLAGGVADGLFSWAAWPYANQPMTTYVDASYSLALGGLPYMMPVSPWFFTNLPGYDKNWLWNGEDLWYDRWQQAASYSKGGFPAPEWIEIISWNDYGESHYIGPLDDRQYDLFTTGKAPYNYAKNMTHDGWRMQLAWMIDMYKNGSAQSNQESVVVWYRPSYSDACNTGDTTGNTASQLQIELSPDEVLSNQISVSALLVGPGALYVAFGGIIIAVDWKYTPNGGAGLYYATYALNGQDSSESLFSVLVIRDDSAKTIEVLPSVGISHSCQDNITNWNAVTAWASGQTVLINQSITNDVCIKGWGLGDFAEICSFTCSLGYCPASACVCEQMGPQPAYPTDGGTPVDGYSANGDPNYDGLCSFSCGKGAKYCFPAFCSQTPTTVVVPKTSPFTPAACTNGSGIFDFYDLCRWSCAYGYCPMDTCGCTAEGPLVLAPSPTPGVTASFVPITGNMRYDDLCTWTCSRGFCPGICCVTGACGPIKIEAEKLVDFVGCDDTTTTPAAIRAAWDSAMDLAWVSSGSIKWGWHSSVDFLAGPERNAEYQTAIKKVLNAAYTYRRASWWNPESWTAWETSIRCDDFHGVCAKYPNTAAAYTVNPGKRPDKKPTVTKDTIVICPKVFNAKKTCNTALDDSKKGNVAFNMLNFQCQGYVILHELFHLDSLSSRGGAGHIKDLGVRYASGFDPVIRPYQAYGPVRTKVLALWPNDDVGQFIVTNADNLAQYSLASWIVAKNEVYPSQPPADGKLDTTYKPSFFNETDAAADSTFDGYIEDDTDDSGFNTTANVGADVLLSYDTEEYLDCSNNGNIEWATNPFVTQAFAESSITTFCASISSAQNTGVFTVSGSDTLLFLGAILKRDDTTCTALNVSTSTCTSMLGQLITGCDTTSTSQKYGGIYHTECIAWVAIVNGTAAAVANPAVTFSCSFFVTADDVACACTDGKVYPVTNETCAYTSPPT